MSSLLSRIQSSAGACSRGPSCWPPSFPRCQASLPRTHVQAPKKRQLLNVICEAAAAARLYEWSYQLDAAEKSNLPVLELQLTGDEGPQALVEKLAAAAESSLSPSSPASSQARLPASSVAALQLQLPPSPAALSTLLTPAQAASLLTSLARLRAQVPQPWLEAVLQGPLSAAAAAESCSTRQLAEAAWAVSELSTTGGPKTAVMAWASALLASSAPRLQDFYSPDLAALLCSCGALHREVLLRSVQSPEEQPLASATSPTPAAPSQAAAADEPPAAAAAAADAAWQSAVAQEACYQLAEFTADFRALDVAQLASGLADLRVPVDSKLRAALMKAVYSKTNTIEEKAAVDFALAKLEAGARSIHFDPRWTHEELHWLPRSERDKRRIIKEGWKRTQWSGHAAGGGR